MLVCEDEEGVRELTCRLLESAGYTVLSAENGLCALSLAAAHAGPIHLLVSDAVMPGMSGRQLAGDLIAQRPDLRVLIMSGHLAHDIASRGLAEEGAKVLAKPFTPSELLNRAREALDAPDAGA